MATEHDEQKAVVAYCRAVGLKAVAVPNGFFSGAKNAAAYINKMKAEGMSSGFPDLMIFTPYSPKIIFIEMKRTGGTKSTISAQQAAWIAFIKDTGHPAKVCFGAGEAIGFSKGI